MTDNQDQARHGQFDLDKQIEQRAIASSSYANSYAIDSDALKVIGAGNAAGVVAAAAALKTFSNHTIIDQDCRCELFIGRAPRKIGAAAPTPQNCRQMIPFRSRSDS
jgi:hypothetical protein